LSQTIILIHANNFDDRVTIYTILNFGDDEKFEKSLLRCHQTYVRSKNIN